MRKTDGYGGAFFFYLDTDREMVSNDGSLKS